MEFYEAVDARFTARAFLDEPIPDAALARMLSAGLRAPTNDHMRDWHFIIVRDREKVARLLRAIPADTPRAEVDALLNGWGLRDGCQMDMYRDAVPRQYRMLADAACLLVPLYKQRGELLRPENLSALNAFASVWCCLENIFLAAASEGYACALRIPLGDEEQCVRAVLGYPAQYRMPCFVGIGRPDPAVPRARQKECPLQSRLHTDAW